jgi:hypothetical protein
LYVFDAFSFATVSGTMFILLGMTGALWRLAEQESHAPGIEAAARIPVPHAT